MNIEKLGSSDDLSRSALIDAKTVDELQKSQEGLTAGIKNLRDSQGSIGNLSIKPVSEGPIGKIIVKNNNETEMTVALKDDKDKLALEKSVKKKSVKSYARGGAQALHNEYFVNTPGLT